MKCPKCGYLGFEAVDRCRNCGYDFSLSEQDDVPDLAIRPAREDTRPFADLSLLDAPPDPDEAVEPPPVEPAPPPVVSPGPLPKTISELPLFGPPIPDDEPLIKKASPPRPPLAVRRATPEITRLRADAPRMTPSFDLDLDAPSVTEPVVAVPRTPAASWPATRRDTDALAEDAPLGARFMAMGVDLLILAAVDALVVYLTMEICGVTLTELGMLPKGPLLAFLLVQNGGYLVAFTMGGQTLGKMIAGIRVVTTGSGGSLDAGRAIVRTLAWAVLAVPAGLGLLTAVFSRDHRGLHDRLARTRVVRAAA